VIEREDQYRFQISATGAAHTVVSGIYPDVVIWLECGRCPWQWAAEANHPVTLADLNDRASEHTEVCR
jgi:hypothetical protein